MQLIVVILQDRDADAVIETLTASGQGVTRIGTTGGWLQQGHSTLLIGVQESHVSKILATIEGRSQRRQLYVNLVVGGGDPTYAPVENVEVEVGGATAFVIPVEQFEQI